MKRLAICVIAATMLTGSAVENAIAAGCGSDLVGAWQVQAKGAPYEPHLFIFHADGTMITSNPTNVQESASRKHGGTNDSLGMGAWKCSEGSAPEIVGTFYQLNANADDHSPTDSLSVTFKIKTSNDTFAGNASVKVGDEQVPGAVLIGKRITVDTASLGAL